MQIFVRQINGPEHLKEWAMIELQGDLKCDENESLSGKFVGDIHYVKDGPPILIIGHHILYGKVQMLDKPFAVLQKRTDDTLGQTEFTVEAIIKKRLCFRDRPKPIIISSRNET